MLHQNTLHEKAQQIRLALFDVDGVFTDGSLLYSESGTEYKSFFVQDGLGIKLLIQSGIIVGIITARTSAIVTQRMQTLGVQHIYQGCTDKRAAFEQCRDKEGLNNTQILYAGDDLPDLPAIIQAGIGVAVANAVPFVQQYADWITTRSGGQGAVREICEYLMRAQNTLRSLEEAYL